MKKLLVIISIMFLMNSCTKEEAADKTPEMQKTDMKASELETPVNKEEETENAMSAIKMFAGALKSELKKAIEEGGPVNAISVCNTRAMEIANKVSEEEGLKVGRVSLKNRNPKNAPNDWQRKTLEDFEARKAKGESVESMTYAEITEQKNDRQFRFMKAIPTGEVCIFCHGDNIAPEVMTRLKELYPDDRATGFNIGDIRGAFVVTKEFPG